MNLQGFQTFLVRKGYGSVKAGPSAAIKRAARAARLKQREALRWPNCTSEVKAYVTDSRGQRYAQYSNGRLVKVP